MKELLDYIFSIVKSIVEPVVPYVVTGLVIAVLTGVLGVLAAQRIARGRMSKDEFKTYVSLLCHQGICNLYAPPDRYKVELGDDERAPLRLSFLSPYRRALKASYRANRVSKRYVFLAKRRLRDVRRNISVLPLSGPYDRYRNRFDPENSFVVRFNLSGHKKDEFRSLQPVIAAQLGLRVIEEDRDPRETQTITFVCSTVQLNDPLGKAIDIEEFVERFPAKSVKKIPVALDENGNVFSLQMAHSICCGSSGSGKGSFFTTILRQLTPFIKDGLVETFFIDPKQAEFPPLRPLGRLANSTYEDMIDVLSQVESIMRERIRRDTVDLKNNQTGRSLKITKKDPLVLLCIDELPDLIGQMEERKTQGARDRMKIDNILRLGRSVNVLIFAASQNVDLKTLGQIRQNAPNKILLRLADNASIVEQFMGADAIAAGKNPKLIEPATLANQYKTAGQGFAAKESGEWVKIRFPYMSDESLSRWILDNFGDSDGTNDDAVTGLFDDEGPVSLSDGLTANGWGVDREEAVSGVVGASEWSWED